MFKLFPKVLLFLLSIILVSLFTSCEGGADTEVDNGFGTAGGSSGTNAATTADKFEGVDFGGKEIRVFHFSDAERDNYQVIGQENWGIFYDAVYERNKAVEDMLGIKFKFIPSASTDWKNVQTQFQASLLAGSDEYDVIITSGNTTIQAGLNNYFYDMSGKPYLGFEEPWWWDGAMRELSIDTRSRNFLIGDFLTSNYLRAGAFLYNKNIFADYFADDNELYNLVLDGKWTIDVLAGYIKQVYDDVNGDGKRDDEDIFAMKVFGNEIINHFIYATDFKPYERDTDGYPVITINNERTVLLIEKMRGIMGEPNITYNSNSTLFAQGKTFANFANGEMLFYPSRLWATVSPDLRSMEADYGILTFPKLDEAQDNYLTLIHNSSDQACVPITCTKVDIVAAVLEAWCRESYLNTTEKFYDVALKTKYTRDEISSKVIDLVSAGAMKNLVYEYQSTLGVGGLVNSAITGAENNFASQYAANEAGINEKLEKLIETLKSGQ